MAHHRQGVLFVVDEEDRFVGRGGSGKVGLFLLAFAQGDSGFLVERQVLHLPRLLGQVDLVFQVAGALPVLDDPRARLQPEDLPTRHDAAMAATLALKRM